MRASSPAKGTAVTSLGPRPLVLCVDDEPMLLQSLGRLLRALDVDVMTAQNGREALALLARVDRLPDLVITDLTMPELGGEALLDAVRRDPVLAAIPVVALSALPTDAPFDLALRKPFGRDEQGRAVALARPVRPLRRCG